MFHFTRCPPFQLSLGGNMSSTCWVSPFGNLRIKGCLPPPRSLSQVATSFIGSQRRGIHHLPFVLQLLKHLCSTVRIYLSTDRLYPFLISLLLDLDMDWVVNDLSVRRRNSRRLHSMRRAFRTRMGTGTREFCRNCSQPLYP